MKAPDIDTEGKAPLKTLSVFVSKEIIEGATPCNVNRCMVAEAVQAKYPKATHIFVDTSSIRFTRNGIRYWFIPPQSVKDFIAAYDRKEKLEPFKFMTNMRARITPAGFEANHPNGDNRTDPNKKYDPAKKRRKYGKRVRENGVCFRIKPPTE